jgi:hypothetical protein
MTRWAARTLVVGAAACFTLAASIAPALATTFGAPQRAAAPSSWNPGKALAASDLYLMSAWTSDCPPPKGKCATDRKPKMGVFVQRAPVAGVPVAWRPPMRVSQPARQAQRASLAADGMIAAVGWVSQKSYLHYAPAARRVFWLRVSTDGGRTWRAAQQLSAVDGRVDYPRIAVSEGRVYAVWTNAGTGDIRLAISDDLGATWTKRTVGTTTSRSDGSAEGFAGLPDVGASGSNVVVVWYADAAGQVVAATSSAGGDDLTMAPTTPLTAASPNDGRHYAAAQGATDGASHDVAIAYTAADDSLAAQRWNGSSLGSARTITSWAISASGRTYGAGYGPAILPFGTDGLLAAFAGCRANKALADACSTSNPAARIDVLSTESGDGGQSWSTPVALTNGATGPYRINDEPSLAMTGTERRVSFDRYQVTYANYRVWMRSGA